MTKQGECKLYQCGECGFHYEDEVWADTCEAWCKEHHSCNLEIIKHAVENKKQTDDKIIYTCPMHSEVGQDKPGMCPECGMNLAPEK